MMLTLVPNPYLTENLSKKGLKCMMTLKPESSLNSTVVESSIPKKYLLKFNIIKV
jgi:hypothetical protein